MALLPRGWGRGAAPWAVGTEGFPPALCPSGLSVDVMLIFLAEGLCPQEPGRPPDALFTTWPPSVCCTRQLLRFVAIVFQSLSHI